MPQGGAPGTARSTRGVLQVELTSLSRDCVDLGPPLVVFVFKIAIQRKTQTYLNPTIPLHVPKTFGRLNAEGFPKRALTEMMEVKRRRARDGTIYLRIECVKDYACFPGGFQNTKNHMKSLAHVSWRKRALLCVALVGLFSMFTASAAEHSSSSDSDAAGLTGHYLYVATPGIRDYLGYGGHGLLVFDIDNHHQFVKRIPTKGFHRDGRPANVKGIAVSQQLNSVFISTIYSLQRIDLATEELMWERRYEGGCDRMSISPDGQTMYLPSLEKDFWNVVNCEDGDIIAKIKVHSRAHNTIYGSSGKRAYMADIGSPELHVADTSRHTVELKVGPFSAGIRPFTINSDETRVFVTVNELLGFEVGDLQTGEKLASIKVLGWDKGPVRRHGNPSHGIGLTPDEKEVWVCDGHNMRMHIFQAAPPYQQLTTIALDDMPGWVTFSMDGQYAYPSSGEVIHAKTREVLYLLKDEHYNTTSSEKMVEIFMKDGKAVKAGDQFGLGRLHGE